MRTDRTSYLLAESPAKGDRLRAELAAHEAKCRAAIDAWVDAHPAAVEHKGGLPPVRSRGFYQAMEARARDAFALSGLLQVDPR